MTNQFTPLLQSTCGRLLALSFSQSPYSHNASSLIAPRPCIWEAGSRDTLIDPGWAAKAEERIQRAYTAAGKPDHFHVHRFEGGHEWSGKTGVPMLATHLKPA